MRACRSSGIQSTYKQGEERLCAWYCSQDARCVHNYLGQEVGSGPVDADIGFRNGDLNVFEPDQCRRQDTVRVWVSFRALFHLNTYPNYSQQA